MIDRQKEIREILDMVRERARGVWHDDRSKVFAKIARISRDERDAWEVGVSSDEDHHRSSDNARGESLSVLLVRALFDVGALDSARAVAGRIPDLFVREQALAVLAGTMNPHDLKQWAWVMNRSVCGNFLIGPLIRDERIEDVATVLGYLEKKFDRKAVLERLVWHYYEKGEDRVARKWLRMIEYPQDRKMIWSVAEKSGRSSQPQQLDLPSDFEAALIAALATKQDLREHLKHLVRLALADDSVENLHLVRKLALLTGYWELLDMCDVLAE